MLFAEEQKGGEEKGIDNMQSGKEEEPGCSAGSNTCHPPEVLLQEESGSLHVQARVSAFWRPGRLSADKREGNAKGIRHFNAAQKTVLSQRYKNGFPVSLPRIEWAQNVALEIDKLDGGREGESRVMDIFVVGVLHFRN